MDRGPEPPRGLPPPHGLTDGPPRAPRGAPRTPQSVERVEQRKKDRSGKSEREHSRGEHSGKGAPRVSPAIARKHFPEEVHAARGETVEKGLGVPAVKRESEGDGRDPDCAPAGRRERQAPQAQD